MVAYRINTGVQQLRGIAALAVVLCHYGSSLEGYSQISNLFNYGQLGVHIFFFISGYVILYSLIRNEYQVNKFFKFILKRTVRIDPAYILTILLTLLTFWVLSFIPSFKGSAIPFVPLQFAAHIFYIVPFTKWTFYNHVFWTLGIEFQFYLLVSTLYFISTTNLYKASFLVLFSISTFFDFPQSHYLLTTYAPIFALGMSILQFHHTSASIYLFCIGFTIMMVFFKFGILILSLILISALIVNFSKKTFRPLLILGEISYSLYIIHPLVLVYLIGIAKRFKIEKADNLEILLFQIIITICISYVYFLIIEKPSIRFSKKISYH